MITSKRHFFKFYIALIFIFILVCFMASVFVFLGHKAYVESGVTFLSYFFIILILFLYFIWFYTAWQYFRNSPKIRVDAESISFGKKRFLLSDIENIILSGKFPFPFLFTFPMEGAAIEFKDGTIKCIYDDLFSNSWKIKHFLQVRVVEKKTYVERTDRDNPIQKAKAQSTQYFKGHPLFSLRGIMLWAFFVAISIPVIRSGNVPRLEPVFYCSIIGGIWFYAFAWMMHYIGLSKDYLIIQNHYLFWHQRAYALDDIREVIFEAPGKLPNCITVITKDFRTKRYPAGTLRDAIWKELQQKLEKRGIPVRVEALIF